MRLSVCLASGLVLGLLAQAAGVRADEPALTIEDAIGLALSRNERAGKATQRVQVAQGGLERARTQFQPTLAARVNGDWSSIEDRDGRHFAGDATVALNQPIVNAPSYPLYSQAQHTLSAERWGAVEDLRVLTYDTASAFITALSTDALLAAAKGRLERARADLAELQARVQAGLSSSNDVTRAQLAVSTAQGQVASAEGNRARAFLQLGYLIGQPVTQLAVPERTIGGAKRGSWDLDEVTRRAEARRPDVRASAERTVAARFAAREPLYRLIPSLDLSAQLHELFAPGPSDVGTSGSLGLSLTWTIYDAGVRYADRRVRLAQLESAALDEHALRRSVATDVAVAVAELRAARAVFQSAQEAAATAQKNTEETAILYKQGLARAIEVTDANASRYDAESTLAVARLSMEQAYLNLRFALGLGAVSEDPPPLAPAQRGKR